jgi:small subunit ribosomal protein S17
MAKKKEEGVEETVETAETVAVADETATEKKPKRASKKASETGEAEPSVVDTLIDTVAAAAETVAETVTAGASAIVDAVTGGPANGEKKAIVHKRAEKIGVVASDKMTKTVTVRVDRLVKHPIYRKYVRRRKKFMAHDELGAKVGDKVRIIETRPMSARKRWRVVEIIQKAEL